MPLYNLRRCSRGGAMSTNKDAAILRRLAVLEAKDRILSTLYSYGHSIDYGDRVAWLACFAEDATLEYVYINDRLPGVVEASAAASARSYCGHAEIGAFIDQHTRPPQRYHKHYLMEPIVELGADGETASARSYFLRVDLTASGLQLRSFGRYLDKLKRSEEQWLIMHRRGEIEWSMALKQE